MRRAPLRLRPNLLWTALAPSEPTPESAQPQCGPPARKTITRVSPKAGMPAASCNARIIRMRQDRTMEKSPRAVTAATACSDAASCRALATRFVGKPGTCGESNASARRVAACQCTESTISMRATAPGARNPCTYPGTCVTSMTRSTGAAANAPRERPHRFRCGRRCERRPHLRGRHHGDSAFTGITDAAGITTLAAATPTFLKHTRAATAPLAGRRTCPKHLG